MTGEDMVPQSKPAEMSFSDWKKMKSALNNSVENAAPKRDPPRSRRPATNKNVSNNVNNNYCDYRNPQSLLYFECLKLNNQRLFGGNMGPLEPSMPVFNRTPPQNMMNCFNKPPNNARSNLPDLRAPPQNMMNCFNKPPNNARSNFPDLRAPPQNMMNCFNKPPNNSRPNLPDLRDICAEPNNSMPVNNNFMMPRGGIPQQPFPTKRFPNDNKMNNPFRSNNAPSFPSLRPKRKTNKRKSNKKTTEPKVDKNSTSKPDTASKPLEKKQEVTNATKKISKSKQKNQKNWIPKPPRPPAMNEINIESKEEKQRMWREYRQKMKPFKNREFYNAKRVVQRLGKKKPEEMDEKETLRLARAKEVVAAHKTILTEKAAKRWTLGFEPAANITAISTMENPSGSDFVSTTTQSSMNNKCILTNEPENKNETDIAPADANKWGIWNNFVPGGVIFSK